MSCSGEGPDYCSDIAMAEMLLKTQSSHGCDVLDKVSGPHALAPHIVLICNCKKKSVH